MGLGAQELPLINNFYPEDYKAESQNWDISQGDNGFIYVANNSGLLEFTGAKWNLYPTPNETIIRSVKVVKDKIYTGFYMDFGFWEKDAYGLLNYTSLVQKYNIEILEDEQIWNIIESDGWLLFQSLQGIYIHNVKTGLTKKISSSKNAIITKIFKVDGVLYFQETGKGIFKIEKGIPVLVSDYYIFKDEAVVLIFKKDNDLIFLTNGKGFFNIDKPYFLENKELTDFLSNKTIYTATHLKNGDFLIGTISNGLVYSSPNGKIEFQLNKINGLANNTVLSSFEDDNNDVWLGLDNGIDKINVASSIKKYKDVNGALGTVYTSKLYKGYLYLGTNHGLFYKKYPSNSSFTFLEGTQGQVWVLSIVDDTLFCGHNSGTFIVRNIDEIKKISNIQGTWGVKKINTNTLLQGNYEGLYVLKKDKGSWKFKNKIKGFNNSSRYFELYHNKTIFVNHEYKGVFKLKINEDFTKVVKVDIDSTISKGIHSSLIKFQDKIIYAYKEGVFKYDDESKTFLSDTLLNKLIEKKEFLSARLIYDKTSNQVFSFSKENINYLKPDKFSSNSVIVKKELSSDLPKGAVGYENIQNLENGRYLIGTLDGYIITDLKDSHENNNKVWINAIKNYKLNLKQRHLNLNEEIELASDFNNIEFSYSVPYLSKDVSVKYQYFLEGYMDNWTDWSRDNKVLFENLSYGSYSFKVKAIIGGEPIENIASYSFSIKKPWYFSNLAVLGYVLCVLVFSFFMDRFYKSYYRRQREAILVKQEREFQLKNLASEKELIEVKNKQLKQDVESKNRELAVSTMSMIKKNELLSVIKKEIITNTDQKSIKKVIKIIDESLNDNDDWKMFEEAFNNADKDFINKIKSLHSSLTPNDLRLCAYLRLNLSSKEIAPLLNISSKSVEVKRYRLRKKMNLPHDVNLTTYILEV